MPLTLIELRADLGNVRDELKSEIDSQGRELKELNKSFGEFREEFAGFRARVETLIDDVPKIRSEFNDFRASIKTYLVVAGWGIGILSTLTIGMIYSSINLTWNASRLHADVAQHGKQIGDLTAAIGKLDERQNSDFAQRSKQIGDLTAAIGKLEERQRPLESLPGLLKSLEETAKLNERLAARLDRLEDGLRPLMAFASERVWNVLITEKERVTPTDLGRFSAFEVNLPGSTKDLPSTGTKLAPTFDGLPSDLGKGIEKVEADVLNATQVKVVIHFKKLEDRQYFDKSLGEGAQIHLSLKFRASPQ